MGLLSRLVAGAARTVGRAAVGVATSVAERAAEVVKEAETVLEAETKAARKRRQKKAPPVAPTVVDEVKARPAPTIVDEVKGPPAATVIEEVDAPAPKPKRTHKPIPEEPDYADRAALEWKQAIGALRAGGLDQWFLEHLELLHEELELDDDAMMVLEIMTPGGRSPKSQGGPDQASTSEDDERVSRRWFEAGAFRQCLYVLLELVLDPAVEIVELEFHKGKAIAGRRRKQTAEGAPMPKKKKPGPKKKRHGRLSKEEHEKRLAAERMRRYRARKKQATKAATRRGKGKKP